MTTALPTTHYPLHFLTGYIDVAAGLADLGVTITFSPLTGRTGRWSGTTETLHLREDAPLDRHLAVMMDLWRRIVLGPEGSHARVLPRQLRVVR